MAASHVKRRRSREGRPRAAFPSAVYLLLRAFGSVVAVDAIVSLATGQHFLQGLAQYARIARLDALSRSLLQADAEIVHGLVAIAPWVSASLLLSVLLVIATGGRIRSALASTSAILFGVIALCPPIPPLTWFLLVALFVIPTCFTLRARRFARVGPSLGAATLALTAAVLWLVAWPELLRRELRRHG